MISNKPDRLFIALAALLTAAALPVRAQFSIIHNFDGAQGSSPYGAVTLSGSTLYGSASFGGSNSKGVVFSMDVNGSSYTVLHNFAGNPGDGSFPEYGSEVVLSGNQLFGTTTGGGSDNHGSVYRLNTDGSDYTLLHSFTADSFSSNYNGGLIVSGSTLYGMTLHGAGPGAGAGTIYSLQADGSGFTLLHNFTGGITDGGTPYGGSLTLSGSKLYGMTNGGGAAGIGTIFTLNTDGTGFDLLHSFAGGSSDGKYPLGSVTLV